jgi:prepilin-type N-terminal cleavage/methylation domain-containing protein
MKTPSKQVRSGFTLMELMVAMAITTIIVTVLVSITSIAIETWNRSRAELRASRQAKAMVDSMARDFEALVTRRGNTFEWLSAVSPQGSLPKIKQLESTNAAELIFFAGSTDRYNGEIGTANDQGGDVSCIAYLLDNKDPIDTGGSSNFETFVLNRLLVNPDQTFEKLLGQDNLENAFGNYKSELAKAENFVCENVYQFTVTFHVEITETNGNTSTLKTVPITIGQGGSKTATTFKVKGTGIEVTGGSGSITADQLKSGRLKAMEVSLTVLSDLGIDQIRNRGFSGDQQSEFLAKNSYQYTKLIQLPTM